MKRVLKIVATASLLYTSVPAFADALSAGNSAYAAGDYTKAYEKWSKSSSPEAAYKIGNLAISGNLPGCDENCALDWYRKASNADYVPALTAIGAVFFNDGQKEKGLYLFNFAARWNDRDAQVLLQQMELPVPSPDLYN